jgi:hypothetical protein
MLAGRPDPRGALSRLSGRGTIAGLPLARAAAALAAQLAGDLRRDEAADDVESAAGTDDAAAYEPKGADA